MYARMYAFDDLRKSPWEFHAFSRAQGFRGLDKVFHRRIDLNDLGSNDCLHGKRASLDAIQTARRWNSRHPNVLGHLVLEIVARVPGDANYAKNFFVFCIHFQGTEQRLRRVDTSNGEHPEHLPGSSVLRIFLYRSFLFFLFSFFLFFFTRKRTSRNKAATIGIMRP